MKFELKSLIKLGGCYYEIFDRMDHLDKKGQPDQSFLVIFFEQPLIDLLAEMQKVQAQIAGYDCLVEFRAYAGEEFERFNGRQK